MATSEKLLSEAVEAANAAHRNFIKVADECQKAARASGAIDDELKKKYAQVSKEWIEAGRVLDRFHKD
jgi:hypothetical protein